MELIGGELPEGADRVQRLLMTPGDCVPRILIIAESSGPEGAIEQVLDENITTLLGGADPDLALSSFLFCLATAFGSTSFAGHASAEDLLDCYHSLNAVEGSYGLLIQSDGAAWEVRVSPALREHHRPTRVFASILMDMAIRLQFDAAVDGRGDTGMLWPGIIIGADGSVTEVERPSGYSTTQ